MIGTLLKELRRNGSCGSSATRSISIWKCIALLSYGYCNVTGNSSSDREHVIPELNAINHLDLRKWLSQHGALSETVNLMLTPAATSIWCQDAPSVWRSITKNSLLAQRHTLLSHLLCLKGRIAGKCQPRDGRCGDHPAIPGPTKRGITFQFFHHVTRSGLSSNKKSIKTISISRTTIQEEHYKPLVNIKDLNYWPSKPDTISSLKNARLQRLDVNLESFYTTWKDVETLTLKSRELLTTLFLADSTASILILCGELLKGDKLARDGESRATTRTMAFQAWLNKDLSKQSGMG